MEVQVTQLTTPELIRALGITRRRFEWLRQQRGGEFQPIRKIGQTHMWASEIIPVITTINAQFRTNRPARADDRRKSEYRRNRKGRK